MVDLNSRIIIAVVFASSAGIWAYCLKVFYENSSSPHFNKRGTIITKAYLFSSGIFMIVLMPCSVIFHGLTDEYCIDTHIDCPFYGISRYLIVFSAYITGYFSATIILLRILLQFINVRRTQDIISWKYFIDPNYTSFALKYFHNFGDGHKLIV